MHNTTPSLSRLAVALWPVLAVGLQINLIPGANSDNPDYDADANTSFNGKPKATVFLKSSRLRLAVKQLASGYGYTGEKTAALR